GRYLSQVLVGIRWLQVAQVQVRVARGQSLLLRAEEERNLDHDLRRRLLSQVDLLAGKGRLQPRDGLDAEGYTRQRDLRPARGNDVPATAILRSRQDAQPIAQSGPR